MRDRETVLDKVRKADRTRIIRRLKKKRVLLPSKPQPYPELQLEVVDPMMYVLRSDDDWPRWIPILWSTTDAARPAVKGIRWG